MFSLKFNLIFVLIGGGSGRYLLSMLGLCTLLFSFCPKGDNDMDTKEYENVRRELLDFCEEHNLHINRHSDKHWDNIFVMHEDKIILEEIEVEAQYRGMKLGSRLLSQVCWLADSLSFAVVLVPVCLGIPHKGLSLEQLEGWYERYGFRLRDDYKDGYPYLREPKNES